METTLAERFRTILSERHLKQTELAEALGVSANYISLLVHGRKKQISLTLAKLVESLYGYSAQWVMCGSGAKCSTEQLRQQAVKQIMKMDLDTLIKLKNFIG